MALTNEDRMWLIEAIDAGIRDRENDYEQDLCTRAEADAAIAGFRALEAKLAPPEPTPAADAAPKQLFRVCIMGMVATDVLVEAESESKARRIAHRVAEDDGFDWGGASLDTTSTSVEDVTLAELSEDERARVIIEAGR